MNLEYNHYNLGNKLVRTLITRTPPPPHLISCIYSIQSRIKEFSSKTPIVVAYHGGSYLEVKNVDTTAHMANQMGVMRVRTRSLLVRFNFERGYNEWTLVEWDFL